MHNNLKIAFFGTPQVAVYVLEELKKVGIIPTLIVTAPDKPAGRKLILTPPPAKIWAEANSISIFQPEILKNTAVTEMLENKPWDLFIVAAYGNILPREILEIPKYGTLNVHPSLLPHLRGASPIQTAILESNATGVTIMLVDEKMDHGPIITQEKVVSWENPAVIPKASELESILARRGGQILAKIIPEWVAGKIEAREQNHDDATFTKKISKADGLLNMAGDAEKNYRKIKSFNIWPRTYFFTEKKGKLVRVIVTDATLEDGKLIIKKVIPEGKKEMAYADFKK